MDIVTLGAALNGSAEYVNSHFRGGSNIQIVNNPDGTQTINASGEVSSEDTVARAEIAEMKDGETLDSFGDVETALATKANADNVYKLALTTDDLLPANTDLDNVKTVGCYYVYESVNVTTITHRPTGNTSAFRVAVELAAGKSRPRQIYQEFNSYDKYIRYETSNGTWAAWKKVEADLSTKQDTISDFSTIRSGAALGATAVQPETGKGLSTNDYTTAEKTKLAGIAGGAEVNEIESIKVNNTTINPDANKVVNITIPTTAADVSALPDTTKYAVALSLTINSSTFVMTGQLKDQNGDNLGTAQTIDLPLESVVVGGSYNSQTKKVVLTLQNGNTIEFSVADLVSGLQTELSTSNKLNPAFIEYDSTHRAVSDTEKSMWNSKQSALNTSQLDAVNSGIDSTKVEDIDENRAALVELVDSGAKNLFNPSDYTVLNSASGVTITPNGDGTYTLSGAASGSTADFLYTTPSVYTKMYGLKAGGKYTIESGDDKVLIRVDASTNPSFQWNRVLVENVANKATFTIPDNVVGLWIRIRVSVASGNVDNVIVTPMICTKAAWDISHSYQPYRPSYQELYEMVKALQANQ